MKIVITGGSSGIGLALAKFLTEKGHEVYSFDVQKPLENIAGVIAIQADVTDAQALQSGFKKVGSGINLLINNAGIMRRGDLFDSSEEDFDLLFRVNVKGSWLVIKESRSFLAPKPMIIMMSSGHALNPPRNPGVYTWTKQALAVLVNTLRQNYTEYKVKALYPGPVDTPMQHVDSHERPALQENEIAHSAEYVADKIIELIFSEKQDLIFDGTIWDYILK